MAKTITSANSVFILTLPGVFLAGIQIQGFATDDAFDTENVAPTETVMGVDGHMSVGYVSHLTKMKIKLQADSPSVAVFDAWNAAQKTLKDAFVVSGTITLTSTGGVYSFNRGALTGYMAMPPNKKTLKELDYEITWESVVGAPI